MNLARCQCPGESAEVEVGAIDPLDGESKRFVVQASFDIETLELLEQRWAVVPAHIFGALRDVVTEPCRHRDWGNGAEAQLLGESDVVAHDVMKAFSGIADEIDFVHRYDDVSDS